MDSKAFENVVRHGRTVVRRRGVAVKQQKALPTPQTRTRVANFIVAATLLVAESIGIGRAICLLLSSA